MMTPGILPDAPQVLNPSKNEKILQNISHECKYIHSLLCKYFTLQHTIPYLVANLMTNLYQEHDMSMTLVYLIKALHRCTDASWL